MRYTYFRGMKNFKETIRKTFDEAAPQFDEIGTPFFKIFGTNLVNFSEIKPGDQILDIACGNGATTIPLCQELKGQGKIQAIDISSVMISECRKKVNELGYSNVVFSVMDAENLELKENSFDKVICGFGLFFLPDIEKGMNEIYRVLKPGGQLTFSSWNDKFKLKWLEDTIRSFFPKADNNDAEHENRAMFRDTDFNNETGIAGILNKSGFVNFNTITNNLISTYSNEDEWIDSRRQTAFRMYFDKLTEDKYKIFRQEIIKHLQQHRQDDKIHIEMSALFTKAYK